eukprot:211598-Chlamydomonas_euryale.AAC.2
MPRQFKHTSSKAVQILKCHFGAACCKSDFKNCFLVPSEGRHFVPRTTPLSLCVADLRSQGSTHKLLHGAQTWTSRNPRGPHSTHVDLTAPTGLRVNPLHAVQGPPLSEAQCRAGLL